ncbi:unnamed protein product [Musa textilis]
MPRSKCMHSPKHMQQRFEVPSWTGLLGVECMQNSADRSRVGSRWKELGSLGADLRPWHGKFWSESKRGRRLTRAAVGAASCAAATNLFALGEIKKQQAGCRLVWRRKGYVKRHACIVYLNPLQPDSPWSFTPPFLDGLDRRD